jgi:hypothetical protein
MPLQQLCPASTSHAAQHERHVSPASRPLQSTAQLLLSNRQPKAHLRHSLSKSSGAHTRFPPKFLHFAPTPHSVSVLHAAPHLEGASQLTAHWSPTWHTGFMPAQPLQPCGKQRRTPIDDSPQTAPSQQPPSGRHSSRQQFGGEQVAAHVAES